MQQTVNKTAGEQAHTDETAQFLTFMLSGKEYGLDILNIKEIIDYGDITEVPMTPDFISGVINLRGAVVPVIDLSRRFSGTAVKPGKRTSIIILEVRSDDLRIEIGVTVDMVNEVLAINLAEIEPAPSMGKQVQTSFISGMAKMEDKLLILLDIENILSIEELSMVGNIQSGEDE